MNDNRDEYGNLLPDFQRITFIGRFIRKYSFDEILQLINVIIGDMSLVGPRPLLIEYLPLYSLSQQKRHSVKPGITGWAQVNGRNSISWSEKFRLDIWYVNNVSFALDMKIIFLTIKKILRPEDINRSNQSTMELFDGSN